MQSSPRGLALIFNNRKFQPNGLPERLGTDVDKCNATRLLTGLGYKVKVKENHSARVSALHPFSKPPGGLFFRPLKEWGEILIFLA